MTMVAAYKLITLICLGIYGMSFCKNRDDKKSEIIDGLTVDDNEWNFGNLPGRQSSAKHTFMLFNQSDADYKILYVYPSCSCVHFNLSDRTLKHGKSCDLDVSVDLREKGSGRFCHKLTVAIEGAQKPLILTVKGNMDENINLK